MKPASEYLLKSLVNRLKTANLHTVELETFLINFLEQRDQWMETRNSLKYGKHKGRSYTDVAKDDPNYLRWLLKKLSDSPADAYTARLINEALNTSNQAGN